MTVNQSILAFERAAPWVGDDLPALAPGLRIGFLFNHDQPHQVAHSLPVALELRHLLPGAEIVLATTNPVVEAEVRRLAGAELGGFTHVTLGFTSSWRRAAVKMLEPFVPAAKVAIYGDNLDFFRGLDLLVVAEKTSLILKDHYHLDLPIVHTRHGAGDRAVGFNAESAKFDLTLVAGPKIRDRLVTESGVAADRVKVVGYPKFDIVGDDRPAFGFADPSRPTVLYNPHFSPRLSSWFTDGPRILDFFRSSRDYNLIFAPHVMLFHRRFSASVERLRIRRVPRIDPAIYDAPNIHVDLGSAASVDMTYTRAADIYIGDVSSQVYEFLRTPKPALFVRLPEDAGRETLDHFRAGEVVDAGADIGAALSRAIDKQPARVSIQRQLFNRTFDLGERPSSLRAALAIRDLLARTNAR